MSTHHRMRIVCGLGRLAGYFLLFAMLIMIPLIKAPLEGRSTPSTRQSSLGILVSRAVFWKSEQVWHYGMNSVQGPIRNSGLRPAGKDSICSEWLETLWKSTHPIAFPTHQAENVELCARRNGCLIVLMQWALKCDPHNRQAYLNLAYLLDHEYNNPRSAELTLMSGLASLPTNVESIPLIVDLIYLRAYRLGDSKHLPEAFCALHALINKCSDGVSGELSFNVKACLFLEQKLIRYGY